MRQYSVMKSVLFFKVALVILALAWHQGWVRFGDLNLFASGDPEKSEKNVESKNADKKEGEKNDVEKTTSPEAVAGLAEGEKAKETANARKSFLSDLFTLPKLNAKKVQKEEIGKYMDLAERKERQIDERTLQLSKREEQLKILEKSIDEKLIKIDEERKFFAKTIQQEKDLKGERLDKLAELFAKMEPKKAAPAFEKLDKDLMVALIKKLKQKQVTTIFENMNPDKSVELTEYFARVKSAKEYDILKELNESMHKEFQDCKGMPVAAAEPVSEKNSAPAK